MQIDSTQAILALLGLFQIIFLAIHGWALLTIVSYGNKITTLEAKSAQSEMNYTELKSDIKDIKAMLLEIVKHRRSSDTSHEGE